MLARVLLARHRIRASAASAHDVRDARRHSPPPLLDEHAFSSIGTRAEEGIPSVADAARRRRLPSHRLPPPYLFVTVTTADFVPPRSLSRASASVICPDGWMVAGSALRIRSHRLGTRALDFARVVSNGCSTDHLRSADDAEEDFRRRDLVGRITWEGPSRDASRIEPDAPGSLFRPRWRCPLLSASAPFRSRSRKRWDIGGVDVEQL